MWERRDVDDFGHLDVGSVDSADSGLTAITGTLDVDLDLSETEVVGYFGTVGGCCLCRIRGVLFGAFEVHLTCAGPRDGLTLRVGKGDDDVIE